MWRLAIRALVCGCSLYGAVARAGNPPGLGDEWHWSLYVGRYTDTRFVDIIRGDTAFKDSHVGAVMVSRKVADWPPYADWAVQAGVARHWGLQQHYEVNAAIMLRLVPWPRAEYWRLHAGLGIGPSWASATPQVERARGGRTSRRLLFMPFEVELGPAHGRAALFARVHHRSGGFDVFSRGRGSNFVAVGGRFTW